MKKYLKSNKAKFIYFIIYTVVLICGFSTRLIQSIYVEKCIYKINSKIAMLASAT